jgi:hypothetical protein
MTLDTDQPTRRSCAASGCKHNHDGLGPGFFQVHRPWQQYCCRACQQLGYAGRNVRVRLGPVKLRALVERVVDVVMEELRQGEL